MMGLAAVVLLALSAVGWLQLSDARSKLAEL
jgi:hypothetical protein